jgi:hypothetical protein
MSQYVKFAFLFVILLCFNNKAYSNSFLSSIPIYDKSGNAIYRTAWHLICVRCIDACAHENNAETS